MAYLAIYRKYRPKNFNEVVGQTHITTTLKNQIISGQISHAYLFCGTRGTGKTSIAKIFAQSINCEKPDKGSACGKCKTCMALAEPNNMDVLEIDAASNNRVDEIRELREKVKYPPVNGKFKVYIIDEVHMLTDSAFNALLKTLEEPPKHVVFILATTEVQKLPATILSRCLRFDFKLLTNAELEAHLINIFNDMKVTFDTQAVALIAALGEGSVRDMLSIADTVVAFSNKNVTYEAVLQSVGAIDKTVLFTLGEAILRKNAQNLMQNMNDIINRGKSVTQIAKDLSVYYRDLAIIKTTNDYSKILNYPENLLSKLESCANEFKIEEILDALKTFSSLENDFRATTNARLLLEVAALNQINKTSYNELLTRLEELEQKLDVVSDEKKSTKSSVSKITKDIKVNNSEVILEVVLEGDEPKDLDKTNSKTIKFSETTISEDVFNNPSLTKESNGADSGKALFGKLLVLLREHNETMLHSLLGTVQEFELKDNVLIVSVYDQAKFNTLNKPSNANLLASLLKSIAEDVTLSVVLKEEQQEQKEDIEGKLIDIFGNKLTIE